MSDAPKIAQKAPYAVQVEAGKSYWWCSCGRTNGQPMCDGSHKGSSFVPKEFKATESGTVYLCGCRHSGNGAMCDGKHRASEATGPRASPAAARVAR